MVLETPKRTESKGGSRDLFSPFLAFFIRERESVHHGTTIADGGVGFAPHTIDPGLILGSSCRKVIPCEFPSPGLRRGLVEVRVS